MLIQLEAFFLLSLSLSSSLVLGKPDEEDISTCFQVAIDGVDLSGLVVESVEIDPVTFDVVDLGSKRVVANDGSGADWDYRAYGPGDAHYGSVTIRVPVRSSKNGNGGELYQWWLDCSRGKNVRKNISVIASKRDGTEARRFNLMDGFPVRWDPGEYSPSSEVAVETITAKMGRVELASTGPDIPNSVSLSNCLEEKMSGKNNDFIEAEDEHQLRKHQLLKSDADQVTKVRGFKVEIKGRDAGSGSDPDSAWETCTGGGLNVETESDSCRTTGEIGATFVDELILGGPLVTKDRKQMLEWYKAMQSDTGWKRRNVTITEIKKDGSDGKSFVYLDCFPTRYVFPSFGATGRRTGNLYEEVSIKPIRLELA